jgi:uncharacterized membrane protein
MTRLIAGIIFAALFAAGTARAASAKLVQSGPYGADDIVLENESVKVTVSPESGGAVKSFVRKADGAELAAWEDGRLGMLKDISPGTPYPGGLFSSPYKYTITEPEGAAAAARLQCQSELGLQYTKELRLRDNSGLLEAGLSCANPGFVKRKTDWRVQNGVRRPGASPDGALLLVPSAKGVENRRDGSFVTDTADGWMAVMDPKEGGLAFIFPYDQTDKIMFWSGDRAVTMEWFSAPFELKPGEIWRGSFALAPFKGLPYAHAAGEAGILTGSAENGSVRVQVFGLRPGKASADITASDAGTGEKIASASGSLELKPGQISEFTALMPELKEKKARLQVRLRPESGREISFVTGSGPDVACPLVLRPKAPPPVSKDSAAEKRSISPERKSVLSGAPSAQPEGHPVKVLVLSQRSSYRPPKELLAPEDLLPRIVFRGREGPAYYLRNDPRFKFVLADERDWLDIIPDLYDYDVLVINDFPGSALEPYIDDLMLYVSKGRGLVILGGCNAYGGRGPDYSPYKGCLESLLPVEMTASPDWTCQRPSDHAVKNTRKISGKASLSGTCAVCGDPHLLIAPDATPVQPDGEFRWLGDGAPLSAVRPEHPAAAGIPLESLAPSFHKVRAAPGAEVIAKIGGNPALVAMTKGKGRILASLISDDERLYFWGQTPRLYRQMLEWAAGKEEPVTLNVRLDKDSAAFDIRNNSDKKHDGVLRAEIRRPDGSVLTLPERAVTAPAKGAVSGRLSLGADFAELPGRYIVSARFGKAEADAFFDSAGKTMPLSVRINVKHKRGHARGEPAAPEITVEKPADFKGRPVTVQADLTDERGFRAAQKSQNLPGGESALRIHLDTKNLAYGPCRYNVRVMDGTGGIIGFASERIFIGRPEKPDFPVGWYGIPGGCGDYSSLAAVDLLSETCSMIHGPKIWKQHAHDTADHALKAGVAHMVFAYPFCTYGGKDDWKLSAGVREKVEAAATGLVETIKSYAAFPAVTDIYIGDEEWSIGRSGKDAAEFKKRFGRDFPGLPKTAAEKMIYADYRGYEKDGSLPESLADRILVADYQTASMRDAYTEGRRAALGVNPNWRVQMLLCPGNLPPAGGWIEETFKGVDAVIMDIYPSTVMDIGMDFYYLNLMRSSAKRQGKPPWLVLGEYRNDFDSCKMQFWLALAANMKSVLWYSAGGNESNGMRSDKFDKLGPYNRFAKELAPLFSVWEGPDAKIAVLHSKAALCGKSYQPYQSMMEKALVKLRNLDVSLDLVTEDQIRDGSAGRYSALVLAGVSELEPDIIKALAEYAVKHPLHLDESAKVAIPGAKPFDPAALRELAPPPLETPDARVYGELLHAGAGARCAALYNHSSKPSEKTAVIVRGPEVKAVYDLWSGKQLSVSRSGGGSVTEVPLPAYDGTVLALLDSEITGCSVTAKPSAVRPGDPVELTVTLATACQGKLPVSVTVTDPEGRRSLYSRSALAENGRLTLKTDTAVNDAPGVWTAAVRDMTAGRKAQTSFTVEKTNPASKEK